MRRLHGFKSWLVESVLQQEAMVRFGAKFRDKDVNNVPSSFWGWLLDAMADKPNWTPNVEDDDGGMLSRDQVLKLAQTRSANRRYTPNQAAAPQQARPAPTPREGPRPTNVPNSAWILAKTVNVPGIPPGEHVVLTRSGNDWTLMTRDGDTKKVRGAEIKTAVNSVRDNEDRPITDNNPEKLWALVQKEGPMPEREKSPKKVNPHLMGEDKLKEEQLSIDRRFEKMMVSKNQDHMMINALAGTGKTTILKHLAWKYGNKNQHWLYLVFNTKNRVEAEEYQEGYRKFPDWVKVFTTNSFLGHLLKKKENLQRIPQTTLMAKLAQGKGNPPEKVREIVDFNPEFQNKLENYGILQPNVITPEILERYGGVFGRDQKYYMAALKGLVTSIRSQFKERVLTLTDLLKAFAVKPDSNNLEADVRKVFDKYDVAKNEEIGDQAGFFDTSLEEVKERIAKYDPRFRGVALKILDKVLGYRFMDRDFKEEIIEAATWLLHKTLPHAVSQNYTHGRGDAAIDYELGEFRDFTDDLWYSAIFSDKLHWDKYDVVLADEVQDFNMGQMVMLKKLHDAGAKIVAVGDPNQAIYRFRGADNDAFSNLSKMLGDLSHTKEDWKEHTLSQNFRSRKNILNFVNNRTHVKNLVSGKDFKDNNDGVVTDRDMSYNDVFELLKDEHRSNRLKDTAFIARTNDPLVHAGLRLLGEGVPFIIVGKDIAGNLINHIDYLIRNSTNKINDRMPASELRKSLVDHEEHETDRHSGKATKKNYLSELSNTTLALTSSIDKFIGKKPQDEFDDQGFDDHDRKPDDPTKTVGNFKKWLEAKLGGFEVQDNEGDLKSFKDKREKEHPVVLTTSHKSKGLEFSRVFILRADQFPSPRAKHPEELAQEDNTEYVAYTRAMDELHIVKLEGQPGYKD